MKRQWSVGLIALLAWIFASSTAWALGSVKINDVVVSMQLPSEAEVEVDASGGKTYCWLGVGFKHNKPRCKTKPKMVVKFRKAKAEKFAPSPSTVVFVVDESGEDFAIVEINWYPVLVTSMTDPASFDLDFGGGTFDITTVDPSVWKWVKALIKRYGIGALGAIKRVLADVPQAFAAANIGCAVTLVGIVIIFEDDFVGLCDALKAQPVQNKVACNLSFNAACSAWDCSEPCP